MELERLAPDSGGEVVVFADDFGVLVQGPTELATAAIEQLLSSAGVERSSDSSLSLSDAAAVGATGVALAAASGDYLRLTAEAAAKVKQFGEQFDSSGALRGYVKDGNKFAGQLAFQPVSLAAEQALAMQTAAVSLALRSAIADVQKAVERVEDKVDLINQHLRSRLRGDVIGTYRHLNDVVEATNARGHLLEADWDSVATVRNQLNRDLETMRQFVTAEAERLTLDLSVPKRESRFEAMHEVPGHVADMLSLILVVEQSLHLYEYLRLQHVRNREAEHVQSALGDARATLTKQHELDRQLVLTLNAAVERARVIEPLEIHRVLSKRGLDRNARIIDDKIREFASAVRVTPPGELLEVAEPGLADARDELRDRAVGAGRVVRALGSGAAEAGGSILSSGGRRVRDTVQARRPRRRHKGETTGADEPGDES